MPRDRVLKQVRPPSRAAYTLWRPLGKPSWNKIRRILARTLAQQKPSLARRVAARVKQAVSMGGGGK